MSSTQLDCSIGIKKESAYGTAVTVDNFLEFLDESLDWDPTFAQGKGLRVGSRLPRSARRPTTPVKQQVGGDITVEACTSGLGALLQAALGTASSTVVEADGDCYQQVHSPATSDYLNSYTIQKGIPLLGGGSAQAFTFRGMQCSSMEFACPNGDIATVKTSWVGKDVDTATSYATPSYASSQELLHFAQGAITLGGTVTMPTTTAIASGGTAAANVRDFNLTWSNGLDDGGFNFGAAGKRARKAAVGLGALTGTMTVEYDATTLQGNLLDQDDVAIVLTLTGDATLDTSNHPLLQLVVPCARIESELPKANGGDVVTQSIAFTGLDNLTDDQEPFYVVYRTADTAI